jgi:nitrate/nitrite-specific signal transduction histidine kinase
MLATLTAVFLSVVAPLGASPVQQPTQAEFSVAINVAGKQRMLSQKLTKEYLLVALGLEPEKNTANAAATLALFDSNLKLLVAGDAERHLRAPPTPEVLEQLNVVGTHWNKLRPLIEKGLSDPTSIASSLDQVRTANLLVLDEMNKAVSLYEAACKAAGFTASGAVINVAGRQRMLSQKISKEICFLALGIDSDGQRAALGKSSALFSTSLAGLIDGNAELGLQPLGSASIKRQLEKVQELWKQFAPLIDEALGAPTIAPELLRKVADLNPQILNEMNKAVTMFEGSADA